MSARLRCTNADLELLRQQLFPSGGAGTGMPNYV